LYFDITVDTIFIYSLKINLKLPLKQTQEHKKDNQPNTKNTIQNQKTTHRHQNVQGVTIILDNASFHRKKKLSLIAERACVSLLFLPAYSCGF
jgi:hypothetical protein